MTGFISASAWRMSSRDMPEEGQGCFLVVFATIVFLVSTVFTWQEIRFALWGRTAQGTIDEIEEVRRLRNSGWRVVYRFRDHQQQEIVIRDFVRLSWQPPAGQDVVVHYLSSDSKEARMAGMENRIAPLIVGGTLLFLFITLARYYREARRAVTMKAPPSWSHP